MNQSSVPKSSHHLSSHNLSNPSFKAFGRLALFTALILLFTACSSVGEAPELANAGSDVKYLKVRVASDKDDAEERSSGQVVTSSTDLELSYDVKRGQQLVGLRFTKLGIPQGAKIHRAEVRFKADERDEGSLKLTLRAEQSDSAAPFAEKSRNLSSRKTSASVTWQPAAWRTVGEHGGKQFTPDLSKLLQEVVNRPGWQQGNAFALLISSSSKAKRVAESYRGDPKGAPQLYIEYSVASAGPSAPAPAPTPAPAPKPAPAPVAQAKNVLYVSLGGSDSNDGRSKDKPLQTLFKASQVVKPGDTIYLRGGVYKGKLQGYIGYDRTSFRTNGTKDKPITIMSYPGEHAIFDGSDRHWSESKSLSSPVLFDVVADHYVIQDLTFRNSAGRGLYLRGNYISVRNVLSHNHHSDGVYLLGNYGTFEDIVSHSNYSQQNGGDSADGLKIASGKGHAVRNFLAYNNSDDGIDIYCATRSLVEHSVAHSNGRGYAGNGNGFKLGCHDESNNQNMVRYNLAYKNRKNNFDGNGGGGATMLHNTSWKAGSHGFIAYAPEGSGKTPFILKNNLSYQDKKATGMSRRDKDKSSFNSWDLKIDNPQFASLDASSRDFLTLSTSSPAIDAGAKLSHAYKGQAPDLGALEVGMHIAELLGSTVKALQEGSLQLAGW